MPVDGTDCALRGVRRSGRRIPARPAPVDEDQEVVDVLAMGLHPRVRTGAAGKHYTSTGKVPMVPGVDGVGRRAARGADERFFPPAASSWSVRLSHDSSGQAAVADEWW
jgi:hypothetical protein